MPATENNIFSDIQNHWAQQAITQLAGRGIISGYPNGTFQPAGTITRAEFAAILLKAFPNTPALDQAISFKDVPEKHWAYKAIQFATARKFFAGYPDHTFRPDQLLPRVQAIVILANGLNYQPATAVDPTLRNYYDDATEIPNYAKNAVAAATENFLVVNYPTVRKLRPHQNATRGEVAALMCQALRISKVVPVQYIPWNLYVMIPPQFDQALPFSDGVAWVKVDNKWGAIDRTGKMLIQPEYYEIFPFTFGLALVKIAGKFRYIDKTEKIVIEQNFEEASSFSEGLALVKIGDKYGYINPKGQWVIQPQFEKAQNFSEGLAAIQLQGKIGYIDKTGKIIIQPQFNWGDPFQDGVALVATSERYGFIDKTGKFTEIVLPSTLTDAIGSFSEGLARVSLSEGDGFINKTGRLAIQPQFKWAQPFSEGLSAVYRDEKSGFIDQTGKLVIPLQFNSAAAFSEGLARIQINGKSGYIDKTGHQIIPPQFSHADNFSENLAAVYLGGEWGTAESYGKWGYIRTPLNS